MRINVNHFTRDIHAHIERERDNGKGIEGTTREGFQYDVRWEGDDPKSIVVTIRVPLNMKCVPDDQGIEIDPMLCASLIVSCITSFACCDVFDCDAFEIEMRERQGSGDDGILCVVTGRVIDHF